MRNHKFLILLFIVGFTTGLTLAQNNNDKIEQLKSNKQLYAVFNKFYTDSIRQETKDEWGKPYYYKIDQINGIHYFDYNNDNLEDALVEFSAYASDGGTRYFLTAVLFENKNNNYKYITHINPGDMLFKYYKNPYFIFLGKENRFSKEIKTKKFILKNNKLITKILLQIWRIYTI